MTKEPRFKNDSAQPASQEVIDVPFTILEPVPEPVTNPPATPTPNPPMQQISPNEIGTIIHFDKDGHNLTTFPPHLKRRQDTDAQMIGSPRSFVGRESQPRTGGLFPQLTQNPYTFALPVSPQPRSSVTQEVAEATAPSGVQNPKVPTPVAESMAKAGDDLDKTAKGLGGLDWKGAVGLGAATIMTVGILNSMAQSRQREEARKRNQRLMSYGQMPDSFQ